MKSKIFNFNKFIHHLAIKALLQDNSVFSCNGEGSNFTGYFQKYFSYEYDIYHRMVKMKYWSDTLSNTYCQIFIFISSLKTHISTEDSPWLKLVETNSAFLYTNTYIHIYICIYIYSYIYIIYILLDTYKYKHIYIYINPI